MTGPTAHLLLASTLAAGGWIPDDGAQLTYRLVGEAPDDLCGWRGALPEDVVVQLGRDAEGPFAVMPTAIPEQLWLSPVTRGELSDGTFGGSRTDTYPLDRLGALALTKTLNLTPAVADDGDEDGDGRVTGSLVIGAALDMVEDVTDGLKERAGPLAEGPCTATIQLSGERVERAPSDVAHTERLWSLLKAHMDALMTRSAEASIVPLEEGLAIEGDHRAEFLWRKARAMFVVGEEMPRDDRKRRLAVFSEGQEVARAALLLDPTSAEASFFLAAHLGRYNTTHGLVSTFFGLDEFEEQARNVIALGSDYDMMGFRVVGDAHHALGQFYRLVPDSMLMEVLANVRGDIGRSVELHRKAVEIQPERGDYWKELGVALACYGSREDDEGAFEESRRALETAATKEVWAYSNPDLDRGHIARLIERPEDACGYSRDLYGAEPAVAKADVDEP